MSVGVCVSVCVCVGLSGYVSMPEVVCESLSLFVGVTFFVSLCVNLGVYVILAVCVTTL